LLSKKLRTDLQTSSPGFKSDKSFHCWIALLDDTIMKNTLTIQQQTIVAQGPSDESKESAPQQN